MTPAAWALLAVAAVAAVGDWVAVTRRGSAPTLEYVCKPLTMLALAGVAVALDPADEAQRWWFVGALLLSLAGDVFLMLPSDRFVAGLASFLLAHVAYVVGLSLEPGWPSVWLLAGVAVVAASAAVVGRRVVGAVRAGDEPALLGPVVAYMAVISAMVVAAAGTGDARAFAGAGLFYVSDAVIALNRFERERRWAPLAIIVTYHLGQTGLVLSLVG